jgi:diaminohydroxyphosphoribosylaminopyrimidine deaminase/5-amino-6-(5-phosphoribosylamino)uracil reductase
VTVGPAEADHHFMAVALRLAERALGRAWPNPAVGCVVVRDGRIVGRGWTQPPPGHHAEAEALRRAGQAALGATAHVSLEPCAHYGRTPPCTMALIHAGIRRVVAATTDPDPRVDGRGIEQLRQAGVEVRLGVRQAEAEALNAGFVLMIRAQRPLVTLKLATSLDGRIATRAGASQWITGERARRLAHGLRASHDAIMVGSGTALVDDPALTCRLPGLEDRSPVRVVLDGRLRLSLASQLVTGASTQPTWLFTRTAAADRVEALRAKGVEVLEVGTAADGRLDLDAVLAALAGRGITRLLVEGGGQLAAALLGQKLVDRLVVASAPLIIGGDGLAAIASLGIDAIAEAARWTRTELRVLAPDTVQFYKVGTDEEAPCSAASSPTSAGSAR